MITNALPPLYDLQCICHSNGAQYNMQMQCMWYFVKQLSMAESQGHGEEEQTYKTRKGFKIISPRGIINDKNENDD